jgi:hypothetical protein
MSPMSPRTLRPRQTGRYTALRAGLTNYWPLNETATTGDVTATNWVAGGINLTSENSVLSTTGVQGNGRNFVSANSERMIGNATASSTMFGTANFTVAFWFRMTSAFSSGLFGLVSNDFFSTQRGVSIYITGATGQWRQPFLNLHYTDSTEETFDPFAAAGTLSAATWHFFCARLSSGNALDVRVNASNATTKTITKTFHTSRQRLFFGVRYTTSDYLNGDLDEVAMWNRRLSDAEVSTLYNSGAGIDLRR